MTDILCTVPRLLPPSPPLSKPRSTNHPGFHLPGYNHHHLLSNKETCLYRKLLCGTLDRYSRSNSLLAQLLFSVSITFPHSPSAPFLAFLHLTGPPFASLLTLQPAEEYTRQERAPVAQLLRAHKLLPQKPRGKKAPTSQLLQKFGTCQRVSRNIKK